MNKENLIHALETELKQSNEHTYPLYIDSFLNLWDYEFGMTDDLPGKVDDIVMNRMFELDMIDDEII